MALARIRSAVASGCLCASLLVSGAAFSAAPDDVAKLLKHADDIKSADNAAFVGILQKLEIDPARLTATQQAYVRYLEAWQTSFRGDYPAAIEQLQAITDHPGDAALRFRAGVTLINILAIAAHYEEAYGRLNDLLEELPRISDSYAREQALGVAGLLYTQAGQYDLGINFTDRLLAESHDPSSICKAYEVKLRALFKKGQQQLFDNEYQADVNACEQAHEFIFANLIRVDAANFAIAHDRSTEAIKMLTASEDEAQRTQYSRLTSAFDSALAKAYFKTGDAVSAQTYAQRAVTGSVDHQITEPLVDGYEVLYEVAKQRGDTATALDWHEKYATAAKGYLNDVSAHALAYQMVRQQVQAKQQQIDALNRKNEVLRLQQTISAKDVVAGRLWIALLLVVLGSICLYAYRTKRSQMKFQNLAQRDGLTGIYNRQHFIESSEQSLDYGAKSVRDACVVVIDLDHFKLINDEHGHAAGDTVIKRVVAACQLHLRSVDVFGRLGGEEFGILMPDCVPERAADMAEDMRKTISEMSGFEDGPDFPVSASFGISAARWSGYNLRQLLAHADSALYQAKRAGRNRVVLHREHATPIGSNLPPGAVDRRRG